jgi:hypothetical protein
MMNVDAGFAVSFPLLYPIDDGLMLSRRNVDMLRAITTAIATAIALAAAIMIAMVKLR